jgi:hypothetical protein
MLFAWPLRDALAHAFDQKIPLGRSIPAVLAATMPG